MNRKAKVYIDTSVISALFDKRIPEMQYLTTLFFKRRDSLWKQKKMSFGSKSEKNFQKIQQETKGMSHQEYIEYIRTRAREVRDRKLKKTG